MIAELRDIGGRAARSEPWSESDGARGGRGLSTDSLTVFRQWSRHEINRASTFHRIFSVVPCAASAAQGTNVTVAAGLTRDHPPCPSGTRTA